MKFSLVSGAAAIALVLGTGVAFAQTQTNQGSAYNPNVKAPSAVYGQDTLTGASANKNKQGYTQGNSQSPQGSQMSTDSSDSSSQKKSQ